MPCNDWDNDPATQIFYEDVVIHGLRIKDFQALLCGSFTLAEKLGNMDELLDQMDWKEVGVSREETLRWWEAHKKEDEARRKYEAKVKRQKKESEELARKRKEALSRLSQEDRDLLGL